MLIGVIRIYVYVFSSFAKDIGYKSNINIGG